MAQTGLGPQNVVLARGISIHPWLVSAYLLSCWTRIHPAFANNVDPDQLASEEANWSGSTLFAIKYMNLYEQWGSSNLIGWISEVGMAS